MREGKDIEERIRTSEPFRTLTGEQEIAMKLRQLGWAAEQGCYYNDTKLGKVRELDVVAEQMWVRDFDGDTQRVRLRLLVECKSASGYHILFSPSDGRADRDRLDSHWLGTEHSMDSHLAGCLRSAGFGRTYIKWILEQFTAYAYPEEYARVGDLQIDAPSAPMHASAFRETNVKGEKTLDNSVVWRATSSLRSASESLLRRALEVDLEHARVGIEFADPDLDPTDAAFDVCTMEANSVDMLYPIVIIESPLWSVEGGQLRRVPWCRLRLINAWWVGSADWWVDVVESNSVDEYFEFLSAHFQTGFRRAKARLEMARPETAVTERGG